MYSEILLSYAKDKSHEGELKEAKTIRAFNPHHCGDETTLFLEIEGETIKQIKHKTDGCAVAKAAAAYLCSWLEGKSIKVMQELTEEHLLKALQAESLPKNRHGCLFFPFHAMKKAFS